MLSDRSCDSEKCRPADLISVFEVDSQSSRELRQYLNSLVADHCSDVTDDVTSGSVPAVVILNDLQRVTSFSDVFSGFLSVPHQYWLVNVDLFQLSHSHWRTEKR